MIAIGEFLKNSTRSGECIESKWIRRLLAVHFTAMAVNVSFLFPPTWRFAITVEYGAHVTQWLMFIAVLVFSSRIAWGQRLARLPFWLVHVLSLAGILVGMVWSWGAFADQVSWYPFGRLSLQPTYTEIGMSFAFLGLLHSAIPISVTLRPPRVRKVFEKRDAWRLRTVWLASCAVSMGLIMALISFPESLPIWTVDILVYVSIASVPLIWFIPAMGVARGDRACLLILLALSIMLGAFPGS